MGHGRREIARLCLAEPFLTGHPPGGLSDSVGNRSADAPGRPTLFWFGALAGAVTVAPEFDDPLPEILAAIDGEPKSSGPA